MWYYSEINRLSHTSIYQPILEPRSADNLFETAEKKNEETVMKALVMSADIANINIWRKILVIIKAISKLLTTYTTITYEIHALADPFIGALKFPKPQNTTQPVGHLKIQR